MGELRGVIRSIAPDEVRVLVSSASEEACGACALRDTCVSSSKAPEETVSRQDRSARLISVYDFPAGLATGDTVLLEEAPGLQLKGAFYAFILPLILMVAAAVGLSRGGLSETVLAGVLFGLLLLYGLIVWLLREKFKTILYYKITAVASPPDRLC